MRACTKALLLSYALISACASGSNGSTASTQAVRSSAELQRDSALGAGDVIDVRVYNEPDLTGKYQVSTEGSINFPFIKKVVVAGKLPSDIEKEIEQRLADGYLKAPSVTVIVLESRSRRINVTGEVKNPTSFPYVENMSIVDAISQAGGFTPMAKKNNVVVARVRNGKASRIVIPVEDILIGRKPNFTLRPGDVVTVPQRLF